MEVFLLYHVREISEDEEDSKLIGVYSSKKKALSVLDRYKKIKGFEDFPNDFIISKYIVNKDHWTEGFITIP